MKTYGDIINRISEIIANSQEMQKTNPNPKNYTHLLYNDIYKDYVSELRDLLDIERTFSILLKSSEDETVKKNLDLLNLCEAKIKANDSNVNDYITLMEIIKSSFGKTPLEITEYAGYFITKEQFANFLDLCRKLKIGPCIKLNELSSSASEQEIRNYLNTHKEQYQRINKYIANNHKNQLNSLVTMVNSWHILNDQEFQELQNIDNLVVEEIDNIDKLIAYFATKKDFNPEALKVIIPFIGEYNYHYMLDELFKKGLIDTDYYLDYVSNYLRSLENPNNKKVI